MKKKIQRSQHKSRTFLWIKDALVNGSSMSRVHRRHVYIQTITVSLTLIWLIVIAIISFTPNNYVSKWTLILPGPGAGANVNLESVGQASSSSSSPYSNSAIDPRENYKAIADTHTILTAAAKLLDKPPAEIGKPKQKLPSQTGIMQFSIKASTAKLAQDKAWAHYHSLQDLLSHLRSDEVKQRENSIKLGMEGFVSKVGDSHNKILEFQTEAGLISPEQFKESAMTIERLRHNQVNMKARLIGLKARIQLLEEHLSLTTKQAADLLKLKNDQLYRQLLITYAESSAKLAELSGHHGDLHPKITNQQNQQASILNALKKRSQLLLGFKDDNFILMLSADNNNARGLLIQQLLTITTEEEGLQQELNSLSNQIQLWDKKLIDKNDEMAKLSDLQREHQVATAVFTSALAKMDVGKADIYSAYPLVQLLEPPSLPTHPSQLPTLLALIGGVSSTILILIGLSLLWIRKPILRKILTSR